jgi:hypothetical protein
MDKMSVELRFFQVQTNAAADIVALMAETARHGAAFWTAADDRPLPPEEWLTVAQSWMQEDMRPLAEWRVSFTIRFADLPDLSLYFSIYQFDSKQKRSQFVVGTVLFADEQHRAEPLAQRLVDLGRALYPMVQPGLGFVDSDNAVYPEDAPKLRLKHIAWVTFFSPAYVQKYGREFLLGLPGHKTDLLPDGGVFHQLAPTFVAPSEPEAQRLRQEVIAYCARHGRRVTCWAPFVIPGLTPLPAPQHAATDEQVQAYLHQILATTLVLEDGTRVKPIVIPWADLTPRQRAMALAAIRQAAIAELKRSPGKRIRLEFNAIPDDLDRMLAELAGRDNPHVVWVEEPTLGA